MTSFGNASSNDRTWNNNPHHVDLEDGVFYYVDKNGKRTIRPSINMSMAVRSVERRYWVVLATDGTDGFDVNGVKVVHVCKRGNP